MGKKKEQGINADFLHESMEEMVSSMLLPISFFMFVRRVIGQVVLEKEKGLTEYLRMNGMSSMAHHLSCILSEGLVNGVLISIFLDIMCKYRLRKEDFVPIPLLLFNISTILFIMGSTAFAILISKMFNSSGFATQIGSIIFLAPIFLSLYLKVLKMKH